jgi:hypothetical protein
MLLPSDSGPKFRVSSMGARPPRSIEPWETVAAVQYVDKPPQRNAFFLSFDFSI